MTDSSGSLTNVSTNLFSQNMGLLNQALASQGYNPGSGSAGINTNLDGLLNPVCSGTAVTFTATPVNGGNTPAYQWQVNGVNKNTNSPTYTYTPVNSDAVTCILTSGLTCATDSPATSNTVTMTVNSNLPVSVSVAAGANPVCSGTTVTFTATPTNGGTLTFLPVESKRSKPGTNSSSYTYTPVNQMLLLVY